MHAREGALLRSTHAVGKSDLLPLLASKGCVLLIGCAYYLQGSGSSGFTIKQPGHIFNAACLLNSVTDVMVGGVRF